MEKHFLTPERLFSIVVGVAEEWCFWRGDFRLSNLDNSPPALHSGGEEL